MTRTVTHCWKLGLTATLVLGGLLSIMGCGRGNSVAKGVDRETRIRMNILAIFYGNYLNDHRGKPPKDIEAFREFLQSRAEDLKAYKKKLEINGVEELLTSARDDQPFIIVCGKPIEISRSPGNLWAAYEQTGVDGKRMAVRLQGGVDVLGSEEFTREFSVD